MPHPRRIVFPASVSFVSVACVLVAGLLAYGRSKTGAQPEVRTVVQDREPGLPAAARAAIKDLSGVIYPVPQADRAKTWYIRAFGRQPAVDQPFYISFNVAGYGLGLDPDHLGKSAIHRAVAYWRTDNIEETVRHFESVGATVIERVHDVGGGVKVAILADPSGNPIGLLEDSKPSPFALVDQRREQSIGRRPREESIGGLNMVKGLGTVIYPVSDLARAKSWYSEAFQQKPYFDEPFYVGFNIAGYEIGLDPDGTEGKAGAGGVAYWRVDNIEEAVRHFTSTGGTVISPVRDVGGDVKVATVADPFGNTIGLLKNPHFRLP